MAFTDPSTSQPNTTAPGASNQSVPSWGSILADPNFVAAKDWEKVAAAQKYYNKYFVTDPNFIAASEEDQAEATRRFQSTVPVEPSVWRAATRGVLETLGGVAGVAQAGAQAVGLGPDTWLGEKLSYGKNLLKAEAGLIVRPPDERPYTEDWWQPYKMAEDVAQAIPGVALAVAGGLPYRASTATATAVASGIGGLLEGEQQYQELSQRGATPEQALLGMLEMTLTSAGLNALPFAKFFGKGWSTNKLVNAVSQGLAEAASEYGEEIGSAVITQAALKNGLEPGEFMARLKQGIEVTIPAFLLGAGMGAIGGNGKVVPKGAEPAPGTEETGTPSTGMGEAPSTSTIEDAQWASLTPQQQEFVLTYTPAASPLGVQEAENTPISSQEAPGSTISSQPAIDTPLKGIESQEALKSSVGNPLSIRVTNKKGATQTGLFTPSRIQLDEAGNIARIHGKWDNGKTGSLSLASIELLPSTPASQNMRPAAVDPANPVIDNPLQQPAYPKVGMSKPQFSMAEEGETSTVTKGSLGKPYVLGDPTDLHQVIHDLSDGTQVKMSAGYNRMYEAVKRVFPNLDISAVARIERYLGDKYQGDALGSVVDRFVRIAVEDMEVGETEDQVVARLGDKAGLTLGHEGLHVLIAALGPNDADVQVGLQQYGSEEALVQKAADHYARLVNGEPAPDLTFAQWLKSIWERFVRSIRSMSIKDRAELLATRMYEGGFDQYNLPGWNTVFGEHLFGPEFGPQYGGGKEQIDTPAFKRWFGDSKVVDKDGKPLVVYHGTKREFTIFDAGDSQGIWVTPNKRYAKTYAHGVGKVMELYVRAVNPLPDTKQGRKIHSEIAQEARRRGVSFITVAKERGYDGVYYFGKQELLVFEPTQIKSATGNIGTFDPANPDIRFAQRSKDDLLKELAEVEQWLAAPPTTGGQPASLAMIKRFEAKRDNLYQQIAATPSFSMKEASDNAPGFREATTVNEQLHALKNWFIGAGHQMEDTFSITAGFDRFGEILGSLLGEQARRSMSVRTAWNDHTIHNVLYNGIIRTLGPLYQKEGGIGKAISNAKLGKWEVGQRFAPLVGIDKAAWNKALIDFTFLYESTEAREEFLRANPDKAAAYTRAFKIVDDYIAECQKLRIAHGMPADFKETGRQMIAGEIKVMQDELTKWRKKAARTHSSKIKADMLTKIAENEKLIPEFQERLSRMDDLNFMPMPTSLIMGADRITSTRKGRIAAIRFLTDRHRKDVMMADLLKRTDDKGVPLFKREDFSIVKVLASYSYKMGMDLDRARMLQLALGKMYTQDPYTGEWSMRNAGRWVQEETKDPVTGKKTLGKFYYKEYDIKREDLWAYKMKDADEPLKEGFVRVSASHGSYISNYAMREHLASWYETQSFTNLDETLAPIWRFWAAIKMAQFYNPFILPIYNVYQAWQAGAAMSLFKGRVWKQAWKSWTTRDHHWDAMQNYGGNSHPFSDTLNSLNDTMNRMARTNPKLHGLMNLALPIHVVKHAYSISQDAAWHMDRFTRMFTYFHLMDMGLDSEMAAKRAAEYMGDYANVPQGTRVFLNKLFFTPTFKIATARMQKNMVKAAYTHARNTLQGKKTPYEVTNMSHGLMLSVGALFLTNMLMRQFGFKDERWGWKYVKNVETEEGPKQLVITWSNPINLLPKYFYRWQDAANPAETNPIQRWLDSTSWELHPIWRTVSSLVQNRNERGEAIVNPFDSYAKIQGDRSWYFFSRTIPMFKWFQDTFWPNTTLDSKEAVRVLDKNVNTAFAYLMRAAAFPYLRSSADQRAASQMNKLIIEYRIQMRRNLRNTDPAHWDKAFKREEERMKRLQERINQVWEAAQESNRKLD